MSRLSACLAVAALAVFLAVPSLSAVAQGPPAAASPTAVVAPLTYADLADLADPATVVARVEVRSAIRLPAQAGQALPGTAAVYIEAKTKALLIGQGLGESVRYLADVPLDARGRLPSLRGREMLVFARPVVGRPDELRLVARDAQLPWSPALEARVRPVLAELVAPGAAPRVVAVREALHVAGNLLGEGETQIFMATANGAPVSITVARRPGLAPTWGVSLSEVVDQAARPPARETLTWYRLACFLPATLDPGAVLAASGEDRRSAAEDYALVRRELGTCPRSRAPDRR